MGRNLRSERIEQLEDLVAQLSAARSAQERLIKLRSATDRSIKRLMRLIRSPEAMSELDQLVELLLQVWDEVGPQGRAQEAAHEYIKELRRKD